MAITEPKKKTSAPQHSATDRAQVAARISACKLQLKKETERLQRLYVKLGKRGYRKYLKKQPLNYAECMPLLNQLNETYRRILRLQQEMASLTEGREEYEDPEELALRSDLLNLSEPEL